MDWGRDLASVRSYAPEEYLQLALEALGPWQDMSGKDETFKQSQICFGMKMYT